MKIKEVELINFRQHKSRKIPLVGNLIGIVGPNGSGKSNFLNGLQFGLVGEVPAVNKDKLLSWGATDGYVELLLDNDVRIRRFVSSSNAELVHNTKRISGTTQVNTAMKALCGLDKELAKQAIFVRQAEIDSILFETPAKREQAFQKLCGMGTASTIYKKVGEAIYANFKEPPNYDEQITLTTQTLNDAEARLAKLTEEQESHKLPISEAELTAMKLSLNEYVILRGNVKTAVSLTRIVDESRNVIDKVKASLTTAKAAAPVDLDKLQETLTGVRQLMNDVKKYQECKDAYEQRKKELDACGQAPDGLDAELKALEAQYDDLNTKYMQAQANYKMLKDIHAAIFRTGGLIADCPICGSLISNPEQVKKQLEGRMNAQALTKRPDTIATELATKKRKLDTYNTAAVRARTLYEQAEKSLAKLEPLDIDIALLAAEIKSTEEAYKNGQQHLMAIKEMETRLSINEGLFSTNSVQLNEVMAKIAANTFAMECKTTSLDELQECIEHKHSEVSSFIDGINRLANENSRRDGTIVELTATVASLKKTLEQLQEKREALKNFAQVTKVLTNVRDWFHYSNGPRTLSTSIIRDMLGNINDFLGKLEAPFSVIPQTDEGLAFRCVFNDGRGAKALNMPEAEDLSGGEKILLATSFRLASYCMFASQLGILSLDEPTVYLDDKNVMRFCAFLEKVKEVASMLGLQIFMATHERSVIPYMDTVIDLT